MMLHFSLVDKSIKTENQKVYISLLVYLKISAYLLF